MNSIPYRRKLGKDFSVNRKMSNQVQLKFHGRVVFAWPYMRVKEN